MDKQGLMDHFGLITLIGYLVYLGRRLMPEIYICSIGFVQPYRWLTFVSITDDDPAVKV